MYKLILIYEKKLFHFSFSSLMFEKKIFKRGLNVFLKSRLQLKVF